MKHIYVQHVNIKIFDAHHMKMTFLTKKMLMGLYKLLINSLQ